MELWDERDLPALSDLLVGPLESSSLGHTHTHKFVENIVRYFTTIYRIRKFVTYKFNIIRFITAALNNIIHVFELWGERAKHSDINHTCTSWR